MATQSRDINQELVRFYLEERGYLPAFALTYTLAGESDRPGSRQDHEIDVLAVRLSGGQAESAILGVVKGYWTPASALSPSMVRSLEKEKRVLSRGLSEERIGFVRGRFGLARIPIKKVLFYSLRSPMKAADAEAMLRQEGIEVVYLEDIVADLLPRMAKNPYLASGTALQAIRALARSPALGEGRKARTGGGATRKEPRPPRERVKLEEKPEPQLPLFGGASRDKRG